jgi:hypothetical protein
MLVVSTDTDDAVPYRNFLEDEDKENTHVVEKVHVVGNICHSEHNHKRTR